MDRTLELRILSITACLVISGGAPSASDRGFLPPASQWPGDTLVAQDRHDYFGGQFIKTSVFGRDERRSVIFPSENEFWLHKHLQLSDDEKKQLSAIGEINCADGGTSNTGFLIDTTDYGLSLSKPTIAWSGHATQDDSGNVRAGCQFRPVGSHVKYPISNVKRGNESESGVVSPMSGTDEKDWAFGHVLDLPQHLFGKLKINFSFDDTNIIHSQNRDLYMQGSYVLKMRIVDEDIHVDKIYVSLNCSPDNKNNFDFFKWTSSRFGWNKMIIHDCDINNGGSGGPLMVRVPDPVSGKIKLQVIGMHLGSWTKGNGKGDGAEGVPYNPPNEFNYARRFDSDLEIELQKYLGVVTPDTITRTPTVATSHELKEGILRNIQSSLASLGYRPGPADGMIGSRTTNAIKAFQTSLGITPTGVPSEELLWILKQKLP